MSVSKLTGEYNFIISFLNLDYTEEDEQDDKLLYIIDLLHFFSDNNTNMEKL